MTTFILTFTGLFGIALALPALITARSAAASDLGNRLHHSLTTLFRSTRQTTVANLPYFGTMIAIASLTLASSGLEAQTPSYALYGSDERYEQLSVRVGWWGRKWVAWQQERHRTNPPDHDVKGYAFSYWAHIEEGEYNGEIEERKTRWFRDGRYPPFENLTWYHQAPYNLNGEAHKHDYSHIKDRPAIDLKGKSSKVGKRTTIDDGIKIIERWRTGLFIKARHTSGTKKFTLTVRYGIEGSSSAVSRSQVVTLNPGETTIRSLSAPSGDWAYIDSIHFVENGPPRNERIKPDRRPLPSDEPVPSPPPSLRPAPRVPVLPRLR
ncbi:MAG: hypothetical protein M2R45_03882 [Verrucomicrobia subdivision 3 bacterium]|nr:hypothetical protein [Limisphaerales bacterium]MCS1412586.1 hypothetical protein [Limisphaerales bacterium]